MALIALPDVMLGDRRAVVTQLLRAAADDPSVLELTIDAAAVRDISLPAIALLETVVKSVQARGGTVTLAHFPTTLRKVADLPRLLGLDVAGGI